MNQRINKATEEIERTKAKIAELQALLPELVRRRDEMENTEIIKLVRSANITPANLPEFLASLRTTNAAAPIPPVPQTPARANVTAGAVNTESAESEEGDTDV